MMGVFPGSIEKLELAALQAFLQPSLGGVIEDGQAIEKGDAILGESEEVFGEGMVQTCVDVYGEGEREENEGLLEHPSRAWSWQVGRRATWIN